MNIKEDFHHLIGHIEDEQLLKSCYESIQRISNDQNGYHWNSLSEDQRAELLADYEKSFDGNNLLNHDQVKLQHMQWLKT